MSAVETILEIAIKRDFFRVLQLLKLIWSNAIHFNPIVMIYWLSFIAVCFNKGRLPEIAIGKGF